VKINIAKRPTADKLINGEIAVNYLKGHETLTIKNTEEEIVGFVNENEFYDAQEIIAGAMMQEKEERIADISRLEGKFGDIEEIQNDIAELEYVVSSSLNDLNSRINEKETVDEEFKEKLSEKELVIASALNDLNSRISDSSEQVEDLATSVDERFETLDESINDIELVISSSLNDLNDRIEDLDSVNEEVSALKATIKALSNVISKGHDYVDLGLPSGTLWANCNIGANAPEEYGDYFAWGETKPKSTFNWANYKWCDSEKAKLELTKYCNNERYGTVDNKTELDPEDDAAIVNWGGNWSMPSLEQMKELFNSEYTTQEWVTQNGVYGNLITSKINGNSIFLPAAGRIYESSLDYEDTNGYYWTSIVNDSYNAYFLKFFSVEASMSYSGRRSDGRSVRPVRRSE
jgi:hypothetical protein